MITKEEFKKLKPKEISYLEKEPFEEVYPRLKEAFPNFPKCVLEQWTYRHFNQFDKDYWWLGFHDFIFKLEIWRNEDILNNIGSKIMDTQDYWGDELVLHKNKNRLGTYLGKYFTRNKTWPKPIIILKNDHRFTQADGLPLFDPYHLLEGHMRLAYMRAHIKCKVVGTPEKHDIWVASVP